MRKWMTRILAVALATALLACPALEPAFRPATAEPLSLVPAEEDWPEAGEPLADVAESEEGEPDGEDAPLAEEPLEPEDEAGDAADDEAEDAAWDAQELEMFLLGDAALLAEAEAPGEPSGEGEEREPETEDPEIPTETAEEGGADTPGDEGGDPGEGTAPTEGEDQADPTGEEPEATEEPGVTEEPGTTGEPEATETPVPTVTPTPTATPAPRALSEATLRLGVGETFRLRVNGAKVAAGSGWTFKSSKKSVAKVDRATGEVTAVKKGTAVVTLTGHGVVETCAVTVAKAPGKVKLSAAKRTLGVGETWPLQAALPKGTASRIRFSSNNKKVATVNSNGMITAVKKGTATITAKAFNGVKAACVVTVEPAPKSLSFPKASATLGVGEALAVTAKKNAGSAGKVRYALEGEGIATYGKKTLTGKAVGKATLTATAYNGVAARLAVTVVPAPTAVTLGDGVVRVGVGETIKLKPGVNAGSHSGTFKYKSKKKAVAKVTAAGKLTGRKKGKTTLTVKAYNGAKATFTVKVVKAPNKVKLSAKKRTMGVGETWTVKATLPAGTASKIRFSSSNKKVATVNSSGMITAVKKGTATITAKTFNGVKATCVVTVKAAPKSISFPWGSVTLGVGEAVAATAQPNAGSAGAIRYRVDAGSVATLKDGKLVGVAVGKATLTAMAYNGVTARLAVTVVPAPRTLTLSATSGTLAVHATDQLASRLKLVAAVDAGSHSAIAFTSSNSGVATVNSNGMITAVKKGTATITARTYNGKTATCAVTVRDPNARALLVGEYRFTSGELAIRNRGDVGLMNSMLGTVRSPEGGAYAGHITRKYNLTASELKSAISAAFSGADEDDVSLFFIATHGKTTTTGAKAGALVMKDGGLMQLGDLASCLAKVKGRVIVLIEACGSGAAVKSNGSRQARAAGDPDLDSAAFARAAVEAFAAADPGMPSSGRQARAASFATSKFLVLTASDIGQESYGSDYMGWNFFTRWLTDGIGTSGAMPADANRDGTATLSELYNYIVSQEPELTNNYGYTQSTQVYPSGSGYTLFRR